jgi:GDP-4-dehydro-6-deoxy-D-mannose reductase
MRALVTGGRGFVGRHLERHLISSGDEVTAVDLEHDVADVDEMAGVVRECAPEAIYHLAAISHVGESWDDPTEVMRVNAIGTAAVLAAARRESPAAAVLVVSSAEVYGAVAEGDLPLDEDSPTRPASPYAASKLAAEAVAVQAALGFGQRVVIARPFNHFGPGQSPTFFIPALATRLVEARRDGAGTVSVGNLTTRRDFTDVRDVVRAYRLLIEHGKPGRTYVVASGVDRSMREVADALVGLVGGGIELVADPALMRPADVPVLRGSAARLTETTGWSPERGFEATLRDTLDSIWSAQPAG